MFVWYRVFGDLVVVTGFLSFVQWMFAWYRVFGGCLRILFLGLVDVFHWMARARTAFTACAWFRSCLVARRGKLMRTD